MIYLKYFSSKNLDKLKDKNKFVFLDFSNIEINLTKTNLENKEVNFSGNQLRSYLKNLLDKVLVQSYLNLKIVIPDLYDFLWNHSIEEKANINLALIIIKYKTFDWFFNVCKKNNIDVYFTIDYKKKEKVLKNIQNFLKIKSSDLYKKSKYMLMDFFLTKEVEINSLFIHDDLYNLFREIILFYNHWNPKGFFIENSTALFDDNKFKKIVNYQSYEKIDIINKLLKNIKKEFKCEIYGIESSIIKIKNFYKVSAFDHHFYRGQHLTFRKLIKNFVDCKKNSVSLIYDAKNILSSKQVKIFKYLNQINTISKLAIMNFDYFSFVYLYPKNENEFIQTFSHKLLYNHTNNLLFSYSNNGFFRSKLKNKNALKIKALYVNILGIKYFKIYLNFENEKYLLFCNLSEKIIKINTSKFKNLFVDDSQKDNLLLAFESDFFETN